MVFGADRFLTGTTEPVHADIEAQFSPEFISLIEEIAETIIPATPDAGGAKAAKLGEFMREIVTLYYSAEEQSTFLLGIAAIETDANTQFGRSYVKASEAERTELLMKYETGETPTGYTMFKQLTIWGYFSSEVGMTQARAFLPIPGKFEGDIPLKPDQKAWAY